jgi:hypothetical protein
MSKLRKAGDWWGRARSERLASVWYSQHASAEVREEMARIAASEGKRPPAGPTLIPDAKRGAVSPLGGLAVPAGAKR